ncbi:MAG: hypothetical protein OXG98_11660 [Gemmatimonadetes bacterium]|nr:hypothetical protein [Gemmatimonadota bacterium]
MISRHPTAVLLACGFLWSGLADGNVASSVNPAEAPDENRPEAAQDENRPDESAENRPEAAQDPPFALENVYKGVSWVGGRREMPEDALPAARELGIEWLALTPFGWMENHNTPSVRMNRRGRFWGETDHGLRTTARKARELGFQLMLKPHIWLTRPVDNGWIGMIDFDSEEEWLKWEADYRTFILHYAELAQAEDMAILCIATELSNPVRTRPHFWKALIEEIRTVYSGRLTYAANWYRDYDVVELWPHLDYIGVNAYFPLTDRSGPGVPEIMAGWKPYIESIGRLAEEHDKPVLFTEVGYKNAPGSTIRPWEWPPRRRRWSGETEQDNHRTDQDEQVNAYEALFRSVGQLPWFRGLFIWKWYPNATRITVDRIEFSPQNKEAERVLQRWYSVP